MLYHLADYFCHCQSDHIGSKKIEKNNFCS